MKRTLVMAVGLMLITLPALSQSSTETDDRSRSYDRRDSDLEELLRDLGDDAPGRRLRRGAGFLLRSGDATMAVRCAPEENMRACVDAATTLLERARSTLPPGAAPGAPPPR
jgi:hypothetical protein